MTAFYALTSFLLGFTPSMQLSDYEGFQDPKSRVRFCLLFLWRASFRYRPQMKDEPYGDICDHVRYDSTGVSTLPHPSSVFFEHRISRGIAL